MEKTVQLSGFNLMGISIRTSNAEGQAAKDLGALWQHFFAEDISSRVPNPISQEMFAVYTAYESDYRGPYTAFIGLKVDEIDELPEGLESLQITGGKFLQLEATGDPRTSIAKAWVDIWAREDSVKRRYAADFEVYGEKSNQNKDSIVEIFLSID